MAVDSAQFTELADEFELIAETITIPGAAVDIAATQPAALAAALGQLVTTEEARQR